MKIKNILLAIFSLALIMPAANVFASGLEVSETPITLNVGETKEIPIVGDDCAGRVDITSSDSATVSTSDSSIFIDNNTENITITAEKAGVASITFFAAKLATYSTEEMILNTTKTINVTVNDPNGAPDPTPVAPQATAAIRASIPETLSIELSADSLSFEIENETVYTDSMTVTGKTNVFNGYTISFSVNNDYSELKHANAAVTDKIPSLTENKTISNFAETAWGYAVETENQVFKPIPLSDENVFVTSEPGEEDHEFIVGVRAKNLAAGEYENELIFTIVANI